MENILYDKLYSCLIDNYKTGNSKISSTLKFVIAEIQRDPNKNYSDENVVLVINKICKDFKENKWVDYAEEISYLESNFLPKKVTDTEILEYLSSINILSLKNKFMAVGLATKYFPVGTIDASHVKELVNKHF